MRPASYILMTAACVALGAGVLRQADALALAREPWLHQGLTALALMAGLFQFVPAFRRRAPLWHRLGGGVVMLAAAASVATSVAVLTSLTPGQGDSGPGPYLRQCALAAFTVFTLWQALMAVLSHDFRSHMVWMAAAYACLATAPLLQLIRLAWLPMGAPDPAVVNLAGGSCTLLVAQLLMTAWLASTGDVDLPARLAVPVHSRWPRGLLFALVLVSIASVLAYAAQAIGGPDPLAGWRVASHSRPPGDAALVWSAGCLLLAARFLSHWDDLLAGDPLDAGGLAGALLTGGGALALGVLQPLAAPLDWALAALWAMYGAVVLTLLALAQARPPNSLGRNGWGLFLLFLALLPSQVPAWLALCAWLGMGLDEALSASLVIGLGALGTGAMATAYGARLRLLARRERPGTAREARLLRRAA